MQYTLPTKRLATLLLATLLPLAGCQGENPRHSAAQEADDADASTAELDLPEQPASLVVPQRTTTPVPGSDGRLLVTVDDVTRGQVMVAVSEQDGAAVLASRSMGEGDTATFDFGTGTYRLELEQLNNRLIGEDQVTLAFRKANAEQPTMSEREKIEHLIEVVAGMDDAVFIRNGREHTAAEAAEHMRRKWANQEDAINTAEQFIEHAASRSSITGQPYHIRLSDGTELTSQAFLQRELEALQPSPAE